MTRRVAGLALRVLLLLALVNLAGCGEALLVAPFTSRVVQREVCRVVEGRPEVCSVDERISELRVRLVEHGDGNVWLYGVSRRGASDRAILGTRDASGGFLFVDQLTQENTSSACVLVDRVEITLDIDPDASLEDVGISACIGLVGRETASVTSSAGCDLVNTPPLASTLIVRRRWEPPQECER